MVEEDSPPERVPRDRRAMADIRSRMTDEIMVVDSSYGFNLILGKTMLLICSF